ncbi:MAG: ABC transporter permease [Proteobacteria bacterium]|nr:ABC transporter permease [Pseudomonadota bacterium]
MNASVQAISMPTLIWAFVPVAAVIGILIRWTSAARTALYAVARMLIQLLLIGYVLAFIFEADRAWVIALVLTVMLVAASLIAIRPLQNKQPYLLRNAFVAILLGGVLTLALVTQLVIAVEPWFLPRYVVPLAGMVFASSMNAVSLAAERLEAELARSVEFAQARASALNTCLIPLINSLFAVGLVSLPGMMTGQILSGVSPFVAAKYQIVVMCMIFGASGMSAAIYLSLARRQH